VEATEPTTLEEMAASMVQPEENPAENDEMEAAPAPDEDQTDADEVTGEGLDDEAGEPADSDDDSDADDHEQPQLFTVKADGKEKQVTLDDLTRSYAGQSHIQRRMEEAAAAKKEAESVFNALAQERQTLNQLIQNVSQGGFSEPVALDLSMLDSDLIGYLDAKAKYDDAKAKFDAQKAEIQQQQARQSAAEGQAKKAFVAQQRAILAERLPEYADPEKGPVLQSKLRELGQTAYGFSEQEIAGITDARHVQVLHDAMMFRQIKEREKAVASKVEKARPAMRPGAKAPDKSRAKMREKQERLRRSGSIEDALDLMLRPE